MERLKDFSQPLDLQLLEQVLQVLYTSTNAEERYGAENVLQTVLEKHPDPLRAVKNILDNGTSMESKFFGLKMFEAVIKTRWKVLNAQEREGIKDYLVKTIIELSSNELSLRPQKVYISKLNQTLVAVLKQEWPHAWPNFIPDLVESSKTSESLCENNMTILRLLSEEVFTFGPGQMTQAKVKDLKQQLHKEFVLIFQLCEFILSNTKNEALLVNTLDTLVCFLSWIPLGYIFETELLPTLTQMFAIEAFRLPALKCLTEIAVLEITDMFDAKFKDLFYEVMSTLSAFLPITEDFDELWQTGDDTVEGFIKTLSIFLSGFLRGHLKIMEAEENHQLLHTALLYLIALSKVDDTEVFKVCLEYWNTLAGDLYHTECEFQTAMHQPLLLAKGIAGYSSPRKALYATILSKVRVVMISKMAKPEEVLIIEDENGEIIKEPMKDGDAINLYKSMRETLIYLTHLDYEDTESIMWEKLSMQLEGEWSWNSLNTLCWAVGSISGAMSEEDEKRFLVMVIKSLLGLCEIKRGKDNKAVIASNIMYVVGQYPRFLRAHWKFLKTVVKKNFEFMHEPHPGVQDMACETFLKIAQKCRRKFVVVQVQETQPFVDTLLDQLPVHINDLEMHQIHMFYEAVGYMVHAQPDEVLRNALLTRLMELPNERWAGIIAAAGADVNTLRDRDTIRSFAYILKTNTRVAMAMGHNFQHQLRRIYPQMLHAYKTYSDFISQTVATTGMTLTAEIRAMRSVKKETLKLIQTFVEKSQDALAVSETFIRPLMEPVLDDYRDSHEKARDAEVLSLFAVIVNKLQSSITAHIPKVLDSLFQCTLGMIQSNMTDFPDHRLHFFKLLHTINHHCFPALLQIPSEMFQLFVQAVVWGFKHDQRNIVESALSTTLELLRNVSKSAAAQEFFKAFFVSLMTDLFVMLTEKRPGFAHHAAILMEMFGLVVTGEVRVPLWDETSGQMFPSNQAFLQEYLVSQLSSAFDTLTPLKATPFVAGLFDPNKDVTTFKAYLRDFLIELQEYSEELFEEEAAAKKLAEDSRIAAIPGMLNPHDPRLAAGDGMADQQYPQA